MKGFLQQTLRREDMQLEVPIFATNENNPTVRLAIYDSPAVAPQVLDFVQNSPEELVGLLATKTFQFSQEKGGSVPFTAIKEIVENLVHASFREAIITILDNGNTIKVSDQGPGIKDKERRLLPAFLTGGFPYEKNNPGCGIRVVYR